MMVEMIPHDDNAPDAVYVRTSTKDQDGEAQIAALNKALAARGVTVVRWVLELGKSTRKKLPKRDLMAGAAHRGEVRRVFAGSMDRLGRSTQDLINLYEGLKACNCNVVTLRENIDMSTPMGRAQMQMMAVFAELERAFIQERVLSGVKAVQDLEIIKLGRPNAVTPDQAAKAAFMRKGGHSWRYIAKSMGVTVGSLYRAVNAGEAYARAYIAPGDWRAEEVAEMTGRKWKGRVA